MLGNALSVWGEERAPVSRSLGRHPSSHL